MLKYVYAVAGGLIVLPLAFGAGYVYGVRTHKAAVEAKAKDAKITILKDGKAVDEKVLTADDSALCNLLGGC